MPDVRETFKEAWAQALVGLNAAEQEAEKVMTKIAGVAGFSADDVRRHARDFADRLQSQRKEIERAIDEAIRRAVTRFTFPSREELEELRKRVDAIASRMDALAVGRAGGDQGAAGEKARGADA